MRSDGLAIHPRGQEDAELVIPLFDASPHLKSLELQGYKTFAAKTMFAFAPEITCIVGPNGSGKSNIADAIRWVLGEQSYRLLRGKRTEDMIFSGSEIRSRAGMAMVSIAFDNSEGWLPIDFSEVTISRRAYRDGQNEYIINGQKVRLRDVNELLAKCGLAERTYNIIGQGLVDVALSLKAEERRRLFEEAAGIGFYRDRRDESLRRLDATRRNLERVEDILAELKPRLSSLERQASRARLFHQVRDDLMDALRVWHGYHWHHLQGVVTQTRVETQEQMQALLELRERQEVSEAELVAVRRRIEELRANLQGLSRQISQFYGERETHGRRLAVIEERGRWLEEQESLVAEEMASLDERRTEVAKKLQSARRELEQREAEAQQAGAALKGLAAQGAESSSEAAALRSRVHELRTQVEKLAAQEAAWQALLEQFSQRERELSERVEALSGALGETEARVAELKDAQAAAAEELEKAEKEKESAAAREQAALAEVAKLQTKTEKLSAGLVERRAKLGALEARREALRSAAREWPGGPERLVAAAGEGALEGLVGELRAALRVPAECGKAIDAALGDFGQGLAFETLADVLSALGWMEANAAEEGAVLLPMAPSQTPEMLRAPKDQGCLGNAASLVKVSAKYQPLLRLLLGRTIVVQDRAAALRLLPKMRADARLVSVKGDLFYPGGAVVVGARGSAGRRADEMPRLEKQIAKTAADAEKAEAELAKASQAVEARREEAALARQALEECWRMAREAEVRLHENQAGLKAVMGQSEALLAQRDGVTQELERLRQERAARAADGERDAAERQRLESKLLELQMQLEAMGGGLDLPQAESQLKQARQAAEEARKHVGEVEAAQLQALDAELASWRARLANMRSERDKLSDEGREVQEQMATTEGQLAGLSAQLDSVEEELRTSEQHRSELEQEEGQIRRRLKEAEGQSSRSQIQLARREEELAGLKRRIVDDFGLVAFDQEAAMAMQEPLPIDGLVERLPRVEELPIGLGEQVNRLRAHLRRIGPVNPEAEEEYREVQERVEFLRSQMEDLTSAESKIKQVIHELDEQMEQEFRKTFDAVAENFRETFKRLFGGGSARLVLVEGDELESSGIDIEARLPGRREQGLPMLSGGERSLTACALIFALLKVSPPPFCVLDEVDAMLDEANVRRFTDMLHELGKNTQFIIITHNRHTVQEAEVIYGVSMGADSTSQVISLKLEDVEEKMLT
jgi:chromosome segregation protein